MDTDRIDRLEGAIDRWFQRLDSRLEAMDARQRESENDVAVLKDRSNRERSSAAQFGGAAGGFVGGLVSALFGWFK